MATTATLPIPIWPENDRVFSLAASQIADMAITPSALDDISGAAAFLATTETPDATAAGDPALSGSVELLPAADGATSSTLRVAFDRSVLAFDVMDGLFAATPTACFLIIDVPDQFRVAVPCHYYPTREAAVVDGKIQA